MKLLEKQLEFNDAMKRYNENRSYKYIYNIVSFLNVSMQIYLFTIIFTIDLKLYMIIPILFIAYFITDFINGYVHMFMDNNDNYRSIMGPFIASFHLHHRHPDYRNFPIMRIYFNESGSKFWLLPFLMITIILSFLHINDEVLFLLILIGILSSIAEVSHFLCHNSKSKVVTLLQNLHILLSPKHHANHHEKDNQSYAFLNGMSDFLLDKIASRVYGGYKENSDLHAKLYGGKDTQNRG